MSDDPLLEAPAQSTATLERDEGAVAWTPHEAGPHASAPAPGARRKQELRTGVLAALFTVSVLAQPLITAPHGLGLALLAVAALLIARLSAAHTTGDPRVRNAATMVGIGAVLAMLWRSTETLRIIDALIALVAFALAADAQLTVGRFLTGRIAVHLVTCMSGIADVVAMLLRVVANPVRRRNRTASAFRSEAARRAILGALIALPIVFTLGALLASADAVFRSLFRFPSIDLSGLNGIWSWALKVLLLTVALGAPIMHGARALGDTPSPEPGAARTRPRIEALVVLGAVNLLYAAFCVTQLATISGIGKRVLETNGLTYAQYARSGFWQLLSVGILTLMLLGAIRTILGPQATADRAIRFASIGMCALTLGVTAVAIRRLSAYMHAYGFTVDRIVAQAGAIVVGATFVFVAIGIARSRPDRDYRGASTVAATAFAIVVVGALHLMNPSARSVRDGIARSGIVGGSSLGFERRDANGWTRVEFDEDSADNWEDAIAAMPDVDRDVTRASLCRRRPTTTRSLLRWTYGASRAHAARERICAAR